MDNNKIDYGSWTVPTDWSQISLKMFQDIERYYGDKDKKFDAREVLHIFTNKSIDEINELPIAFVEILMDKLSFLQESPKEKEPSNKIKVDGETYIINIMEKLRTGEFIAVDSVLKDDKYDYASILAILCRKEGEIYDSKFEAEVFEKRREMWERQPITSILPLISFFINCYIMLETPSQVSSLVEVELNRIQQLIRTSPKIGVFKKRYLSWQVKKLRKSLKSSKNT